MKPKGNTDISCKDFPLYNNAYSTQNEKNNPNTDKKLVLTSTTFNK